MRTASTYSFFFRSIAFVLMLGVLFSSTFSSVSVLCDIEPIELLDLADKDSEEEKNEKEKNDKIQGNKVITDPSNYQEALSMAKRTFLGSHQFGEINTPPPEFLI